MQGQTREEYFRRKSQLQHRRRRTTPGFRSLRTSRPGQHHDRPRYGPLARLWFRGNGEQRRRRKSDHRVKRFADRRTHINVNEARPKTDRGSGGGGGGGGRDRGDRGGRGGGGG